MAEDRVTRAPRISARKDAGGGEGGRREEEGKTSLSHAQGTKDTGWAQL